MKSFYYLLVIGLLFFGITLSTYGQNGGDGACGNNSNEGLTGDGDDDEVDVLEDYVDLELPNLNFNPYTGNVSRESRDLEMRGTVNNSMMEWRRYYNSRGFIPWNFSFLYIMYKSGPDEQERDRINVIYPEGGENVFTREDSTTWSSPPGVDKQLTQADDIYSLQTADGSIYRFEELPDSQTGEAYFQLQEIVDNQQNVFELKYSNKSLVSVTDPTGRALKIAYTTIEGSEMISSVTSSDGRTVTYNYTTLNDGETKWLVLSNVIYPDGTKASFEYSQTEPGIPPTLAHAIDPRYIGVETDIKYTYSADISQGFLQQQLNGKTGEVLVTLISEATQRLVCYPNGRVLKYTYPEELNGSVEEFTDGLGFKTTYTYNNGFIATQTDAKGHVLTFERSAFGNPLLITYPDGTLEKFDRDDLDLITTHTLTLPTTNNERIITYTRDSKHRVEHIDYPDGTYETFTYFEDFNQVKDHRRRNGYEEHFEYDQALLTAFRDAAGNQTKYTYNSTGLVETVTDARGNTTQFEWDKGANDIGLLTKVTYPDDAFRAYQYDDFGNRTAVTDELEHTWSTQYDEFRRPMSTIDPLERVTKYSYDLAGGVNGSAHTQNRPTKITLPSGKSTSRAYDVEWQLLQETADPGGEDEAKTFYEYDQVGNLKTLIDPRGKTWAYDYDERDRRNLATNPLGNTTRWTYDGAGNVLTVIRPDNGVTENNYDNLFRLTQTTDPKGQVTNITYDDEDNIDILTDPKKNTYDFEFDELNRLEKLTYPGGLSESYTYDPVGNLHTYTTRAGQVRTYEYDERNRETKSSWYSPYPNDFTPTIERDWDPASRPLKIWSSVSTLTYEYTDANELVKEIQDVAGAGGAKTVQYEYNADGLRENLTNPDGSTVQYAYTGRNQVKSIAAGGPVVQYEYDVNGNRTQKTLQNGTLTGYEYDDANRLLILAHQNPASFAHFEYGYDNVNRRTFVKRDSDKTDEYFYDAIDQIDSVRYNNAASIAKYNWDPAGNRSSVVEGGDTTSYATNILNQYTQVGTSQLKYFKNGNLWKYEGWTYKYDAQNRLIAAQKDTSTVTFAYDPLNRCVVRTADTTPVILYYDGWELIDERNASDAQVAGYVHGAWIDEILLKSSSGTSVYYHHDALGSVTHLTTASGTVAEKYIYDVFGAPIILGPAGDTLATSAYANRFLFTGREYIQEVGLYDYRNRMYSPYLGRFLQPDPMRSAVREANFYRYAGNNPNNLIDPLGLQGEGDEEYNEEEFSQQEEIWRFDQEMNEMEGTYGDEEYDEEEEKEILAIEKELVADIIEAQDERKSQEFHRLWKLGVVSYNHPIDARVRGLSTSDAGILSKVEAQETFFDPILSVVVSGSLLINPYEFFHIIHISIIPAEVYDHMLN